MASEFLGSRLRSRRLALGLTLDEVSGRTGISKPYLSLIETGKVANPPSDEKLRLLEQSLGFSRGALIAPAHLQRTPADVRALLSQLLRPVSAAAAGPAPTVASSDGMRSSVLSGERLSGKTAGMSGGEAGSLDLDRAYWSGALQDWVEQHSPNVEAVPTRAVPVINRVSAGYPSDFTDPSYPPRVADEYVGCPELNDKDAFAARVHGDSMSPKYGPGDIVIFSPAAAPRSGDDCFVRFADGQTTFKRVFFEEDGSNGPAIRLQPRNDRYRPQSVDAEQVSGLYKAIYRYQRVDEE